MKLGIHITKFDWPGGPANIGPKLAEIAKTADEAGFHSLWVMDHFFQLGEQYGILHGPIEAPMLEGYSTMAYLAGLTRRIKLGLLVTCSFYRQPGLLVKTVSTLDVLSGGRAYLGLGAGWFEREALGLGFPLPGWKERYERLEEILQIVHQMWSGEVKLYHGRYYQLAETLNVPQPLSQPHPPILIGGEGEKKTLRLVAQYADASNFVFGAPVEEFGVLNIPYEKWFGFLRHKLQILQQHCSEVGRPYHEIEKTTVTYVLLAPNRQSPAEIVDLCGKLNEMGFQQVMLILPNIHEIEPLRILGEQVIPKIDW